MILTTSCRNQNMALTALLPCKGTCDKSHVCGTGRLLAQVRGGEAKKKQAERKEQKKAPTKLSVLLVRLSSNQTFSIVHNIFMFSCVWFKYVCWYVFPCILVFQYKEVPSFTESRAYLKHQPSLPKVMTHSRKDAWPQNLIVWLQNLVLEMMKMMDILKMDLFFKARLSEEMKNCMIHLLGCLTFLRKLFCGLLS